jgi:hypothetical protein
VACAREHQQPLISKLMPICTVLKSR